MGGGGNGWTRSPPAVFLRLTQVRDVFGQLAAFGAGEAAHRLLARRPQDVGVDGS